MASLLQKLSRTMRGASPRTQKGYEETVVKIEAGAHIEQADVEQFLDGRSFDDLQADVQRMQSRRKAVADLEACKPLEQQHANLIGLAKAAENALEADPYFQMLKTFEAKQIEFDKLRAKARDFGADMGRKRSAAMHLLNTTYNTEAIDRSAADLQGQINLLAHEKGKIALQQSELKSLEDAQNELTTLPHQIDTLRTQKTSEAATQAAGLMARMVGLRKLVGDFTERARECERFDKEIAKFQVKIEKVRDGRLDPLQMEFSSKPKYDMD